MPGETSALARGRSVDRFLILDRVGEGGMGIVYAAYDPTLDRRLALKFLRNPSSGRDGVREARLLREAQAMALLSHPNVAVLYEVGTFQGQASHAIRVEELGPEHVAVTYSMALVAEIESWLGNIDRSMELAAAALAIRRKAHDPHGVYVGSIYHLMGQVQSRAGRLRAAERSLDQAIQILMRTVPDKPGTADALMHLGLVHNRRGQYGKALDECRRAREVLSRNLGEGNVWLLRPKGCLAEALIGTDRPDAARQELEPALTPSVERELGPHLTAGPRFQLARASHRGPRRRNEYDLDETVGPRTSRQGQPPSARFRTPAGVLGVEPGTSGCANVLLSCTPNASRIRVARSTVIP